MSKKKRKKQRRRERQLAGEQEPGEVDADVIEILDDEKKEQVEEEDDEEEAAEAQITPEDIQLMMSMGLPFGFDTT